MDNFIEKIAQLIGALFAMTVYLGAWAIIVLFILKCCWFIIFRFLM